MHAATGQCTLAAAVAVAGIGAGVARAQWTVTDLHPTGAETSMAYGVQGGEQVGFASFAGGIRRAALWRGSAQSWVDLHPSGATESFSYDVQDGQQVGSYTLQDGRSRAGYWTGSPGSWTSLHASGWGGSRAFGAGPGVQVGEGSGAILWRGSDQNWVQLAPGYSLFDATDTQQVGRWIAGDGSLRAGLWAGTPESFIDLHPGGRASMAMSVHGGQQVGSVEYSNWRAALWRGSASSFVSLHPAGAIRSFGEGVYDGMQVGGVMLADGKEHAALWRGDADSWEDLHLSLPPDWQNSRATGIWSDGETIYVVGWASTFSISHAFLWTHPVLCAADFNADGLVDSRDFIAFLNAWAAGDARADFDADGVIDSRDVIAFLNAWSAGC